MVLENFPKSFVLAGHVKMREKMAIIRGYDRQKDNVLKSLLSAPNLEQVCVKDVNIHDIIQAVNADREKRWNYYRVIQVSCV